MGVALETSKLSAVAWLGRFSRDAAEAAAVVRFNLISAIARAARDPGAGLAAGDNCATVHECRPIVTAAPR
jgi:hypothetical protein